MVLIALTLGLLVLLFLIMVALARLFEGEQRCGFPRLEADPLAGGRGTERGRRRPADDRGAERPATKARREGDHRGGRRAAGPGGSGDAGARPWAVRRGRGTRRVVGPSADRRLRLSRPRAGRPSSRARLAGARNEPERAGPGSDRGRRARGRRGRSRPARAPCSTLCGDVAVVVWLLGSAAGERRMLRDPRPRLERLLEKLVDRPVRGFAYEADGSVDAACWPPGGGSSSGRGRRGESRSRSSPRAPPGGLGADARERRGYWPFELPWKAFALLGGAQGSAVGSDRCCPAHRTARRARPASRSAPPKLGARWGGGPGCLSLKWVGGLSKGRRG